MPIYEYRCTSCNCEFEHLSLSSQDAAPKCPTCCTTKVQRLLSAGAIRPQGVPSGSGGFTPPNCKPSGGG
ncbi:MAG: zinc ribbon domain-containing protein [Desulfobacteraceae bacterium]